MIMQARYILAAFLLLTAMACEKQLNIDSVTNLTNATYYKTAEDAKAALGACYKSMGVLDPFFDLVTTDDAVPFLSGAADRVLLWRYNLTPSNSFINGYAGAYAGINRSNILIGRVPGIPMDENLKARYIAEAKVLRALHYFNLVRLYGGVPVVTAETATLEGLEIPRNTVSEVYAQIEKDLSEAESVLPPGYTAADAGRVTSGAAKGLLAKVYLTRAGTEKSSPFWAQAAAKAREVMDQGVYDLYTSYADAFALTARGGKENMLEVQYLTDVYGHGMGRGYGPRAAPIFPGGGSAIARPTESLYNGYAANDKRRAVTFMTSYTYNGVTTNLSITDPDPGKAVSFQKLWDRTAKTNGGEGTSRPVLRFADVLLIYAEALNEANGGPTVDAYTALNRVRKRAGLDDLDGLNHDTFRAAVWQERRLELAFENHRRFDLVRTGRLVDAVKAENSYNRNPEIQPFHVLFPIPLSDMDANPMLEQNDGY
jgi:hypothetical protein